MDEKPKSIWKKPWKGWCALLLWLITLFVGAFLILFSLEFIFAGQHSAAELAKFAALCAFGCVLAFLAIVFIRWLFCWRNFQRFLFGLACFATLIALFYAEENWRGEHDWEKYKLAEEAKGEKFDWQSVVPPPVPDDQNFAMSPVWIAEERYTFQNTPKRAEAWYGDRIYSAEVSRLFPLMPVQVSGLAGTNAWVYRPRTLPEQPDVRNEWAAARFTDLKPWQSYYRALEITNPAVDIPTSRQPQSPAADVLLALGKYDPVIEQLRADSHLPYSRFPVIYDTNDPADILLPHLAATQRIAQVLNLHGLAELDNDQPNGTFDDIKLSFRLIDASRTDPFLISHLVRLALLNLTLQPVWEGLAKHEWSDDQLVALDADLARLDFLADYETSLHSERAGKIAIIHFLQHQRSPGKLKGFLNIISNNHNYPNANTLRNWLYYFLAPNGWFEESKINLSRYSAEYEIPVANSTAQVVSVSKDNIALAAQTTEIQRGNFIRQILIPAWWGDPSEKFAYGQTCVNLARIAIALERYRLAHGEFPESLDPLAPQFMSELPHDIINGQPLHYRRTADGQFVLYSVGWNETDDGGVVIMKHDSNPGYDFNSQVFNSQVDLNQGDWVWRYPSRN
ncbi:MAG: hypothetical protein ABSF34_10940 [Verrucomicrobiota bacterium]